MTYIDCDYTSTLSTEEHDGFPRIAGVANPSGALELTFVSVTLALVFNVVLHILCLTFVFCWQRTCLSSDSTITVSPFCIFEIF